MVQRIIWLLEFLTYKPFRQYKNNFTSLYSSLFEDLNKYAIANYGWSINRISFVKIGKLIIMNFFAHAEVYSVSTEYTVLNLSLPSGYKPPVDVIGFSGIMSNGDWTNAQACPVTVDIDNKVKVVTPPQKTSGYLSGNLVWCARG